MSENWHQERDRIVALLDNLASGKITHFDEKDRGSAPLETTAVTERRLKRRLVVLESRIGL